MSSDPSVVFGGNNRFAKLIDFGQSIDMTKYPPNTTFMAKVTTKCFQCIEMKTNRPWTYQVNTHIMWFCILRYVGMPCWFFTIFAKGKNLCKFMFASLDKEFLPKSSGDQLFKERICS